MSGADYGTAQAIIKAMGESIRAKDAEIARLREALKPFARVADIFNERAGNRPREDGDPVHEWEDHRVGVRLLTVGDFRKADAALEGGSDA